jgi:MFS family permease
MVCSDNPDLATFQAFMTGRASFYITRALIGLFEGGFIPGVILMATYFYTSRELSVRLAAFWSTLNVAST